MKHLPGVVLERSEIGSSPVTLRHLLAHTSGMPSSGERAAVFDIKGEKIQLPLQVNPAGYWYAYSNDSYVLMKHVIEAATGNSYSENMRLKVFKPLGMLHSSAESSNGTGGIVTTMNDLVKYVSFLVRMGRGKRGPILSADSFMQMLASSVETPGLRNDYYYSLGWEVIRVHGRMESFYKAGRWFGGASGVQVFPGKRIAIVYLCDPPDHLSQPFMQWRQSLTGRLRSLARQYADDPALCTVWPRLSQADMQPYEGTYRNRINGHTIHVELTNGGLNSDHPGRMVPLRPFTSIRFIPESGSTLHNFVWRDRRVSGLAIRTGFYDRIR
jgi:CubicO group peptidase (beta-lactamase class C family)